MKKLNIVLLFLVLVLGFLLRAQETLSNNFLFLLDQGRDMMAIKDILYNHHFTLIGPNTSLQGVFQGPLWYYLIAIPTFLTNGDPWGGLVVMLIMSILVMLISFLWIKNLFSQKAALITSFLLAISPEAITSATYVWNPHPMWLLITFYIFVFYKISLGNKKYHLLLWSIIALMFHFQTALAIFILLASLLYLLIFNVSCYKTKHIYLGFFISLLFFLPQIIFDLRHNFLMSSSFLNLFHGKDQGLFVGGENTNYYSNLINGHLYSFTINFISSFLHDGFMKAIPFLFFTLLVFMTFFGRKLKFISDKENNFVLMCTKILLLIIALSMFYPFPLRYWFLTGLEMFYILPLGLFLGIFLNYHLGKIAVYLLIIISIIFVIPQIYALYFKSDYGGVAKIKGKEEAIDFIYKDASQKPFNLLVFNPPVYTYAYDYLVWWYGGKKYNYLPGSEKKGTFYLLVEPDWGKPWSYKGWMETVVKTGKVIWTKQLNSGLIVQKRSEK